MPFRAGAAQTPQNRRFPAGPKTMPEKTQGFLTTTTPHASSNDETSREHAPKATPKA